MVADGLRHLINLAESLDAEQVDVRVVLVDEVNLGLRNVKVHRHAMGFERRSRTSI